MRTANAVRVRFPPSPTGLCHVGTARMAIVNFLFARKNDGEIIFRSEDTDKERSSSEFEADILESLTWLGLSWDEFYRQSERTSIYTDMLQKLVDEDKAYVSEEESKKEAGVMMRLVRLRNAGTSITFTDIIRGEITFDTTELEDFVIARALDDPLYHFAVVVDDALMNITHVIRGEEHISNTPRQILIQEALGFSRPQYAHYPLHLGADKSKLSKRKGDVSVRSYREKGYLPEALLNYIAVLGWTPPSNKEFLSLEEMVAQFDLSDVHKSGAVFDVEKLNWFNRHYMLSMEHAEFAKEGERILSEAIQERGIEWRVEIGERLIPLIKERISVWDELKQLCAQGEFDYFFKDPDIDSGHVPFKNESREDAARHLGEVHRILTVLSESGFDDPEIIKAALWEYASQHGKGDVLWPLRYALSGRDKSPDPFTIASIIGKEATERRVSNARELLEK